MSTTNNRRTTGEAPEQDGSADADRRSDREWLASIEAELGEILGHQG